jgi:hypothetical protein
MDKDDTRILMGGGGSGNGTANGASIYYGTYNQEIRPNEKENEDDVDTYNYPLTSLEKEDAEPRIDDMILDESGSLYRIREQKDTYFLCTLLPLSGSGTVTIIRPDVYIHPVENPTIVNGNVCEISYTVKAYETEQGPLASNLQVSWMLVDAYTKQAYYKEPIQNIPHGETRTIELTHLLKPSMDTEIIITAKASGHEIPHENSVIISSVEMKLQHPSSYTPFKTYPSTGLSLSCEATGKLPKILECKVDGVVAFT